MNSPIVSKDITRTRWAYARAWRPQGCTKELEIVYKNLRVQHISDVGACGRSLGRTQYMRSYQLIYFPFGPMPWTGEACSRNMDQLRNSRIQGSFHFAKLVRASIIDSLPHVTSKFQDATFSSAHDTRQLAYGNKKNHEKRWMSPSDHGVMRSKSYVCVTYYARRSPRRSPL